MAISLNLAELARIWRGGCIIRARFLNDIRQAFLRDPGLANLLIDPEFAQVVNSTPGSPAQGSCAGCHAWHSRPGFQLGIGLLDAYRSDRLPANLTQAQRDYFGAHTYRRVDREGTFHTQWKKKIPAE